MDFLKIEIKFKYETQNVIFLIKDIDKLSGKKIIGNNCENFIFEENYL